MSSTSEIYCILSKRKKSVITAAFILLVLVSAFALGCGSTWVEPAETIGILLNALPAMLGLSESSGSTSELIILNLRLPRIALAILAGISLAVAGAVMQGLLRNPLVSPFTLGLSSAASFGAALMIVAGPIIFGTLWQASSIIPGISFSASTGLMIGGAFIFGWMSVIFIYMLSRRRLSSQSTIILAGVVIGYLFQAGLMVLQYISSDEALRDIVTWLMGGMWGASTEAVLILTPIVLVCFCIMEYYSLDLNTLSAGDDVAKNLGINTARFRITGLLVVSFAASASLAFTGIIGFIGLMAPHIARMLIGNDYRYLLPLSAILGALILLISDTAARIVIAPLELPVGVIMYILGGIFFLYLVTGKRGRMLE